MSASIIYPFAVLSVGTLSQGSAPDIPWVRITLVMLLCIGLAFVAVGFLRIRYGLPFLPDRITNPITSRGLPSDTQAEKLEIKDRLAAGPSSQFLVLGRGERRYLIHIAQHGATVIDQYSEVPASENEETEPMKGEAA
ncbi:MAG: hypothetical protein ABJ205_15515 [Erythrobacter sp.]|uniref:hypothetical protein n=1 Tax=Erythrobacter sp. TaxID=1042 RepID=UPI0032663DF0